MDIPKMHALAVDVVDAYLPQDWTIKWERMDGTAGLCNHTDRVLVFNPSILASYSRDEVLQVVLHEVAHAIVGPGKGHGRVWKDMARRLGYTGEATVREPTGNLGDWGLRISVLLAVATWIWFGPVMIAIDVVWLAVMGVVAWYSHKPYEEQYDTCSRRSPYAV